MKMPDSVDDLTIYCENSATVSLDNQSALSETMSDALCRVATGDGNVKRSLFTTRDLAVFRGSRPIFVNGITDVVTRDDLLELVFGYVSNLNRNFRFGGPLRCAS